MEQTDDQVGDAEISAVRAERTGDREGDDEHRRDRREHRDPHGVSLGVQGVRQPGVPRPGPPERAEEEQPSEETSPGRVVREEARYLREGGDEDEIEEELEGRDPLTVLRRPVGHVRSHPTTCSTGQPDESVRDTVHRSVAVFTRARSTLRVSASASR